MGEGGPVALAATTLTPLAALEEAVAVALSREPCVVSFSGGGDSSAVLAVAVRVARERGSPLRSRSRSASPACRPPKSPAGRSVWSVTSAFRTGFGSRSATSSTSLAPARARGLAQHGLLWPANAHFHAPVFERAAGGSALTGLDGDGLLGGWRWQRARAVIERIDKAEPRDALRLALALAPASLRAAALARRQPLAVSWLRPAARQQLVRSLARELASEPRAWPARVAWFARRRYLRLGIDSLALLASEHDVEVHHPLLDPGFLSALAADGGRGGYGTRIEATRTLFGDLLPAEVVERRTKAEFGTALWGPQARAFAAGWDGTGVDAELVDERLLRTAWSAPNPPLGAATLLQVAWLDANRSGGAASPPLPHTPPAAAAG